MRELNGSFSYSLEKYLLDYLLTLLGAGNIGYDLCSHWICNIVIRYKKLLQYSLWSLNCEMSPKETNGLL